MGLCIGGGSVPNGTADQYLAAFGYSAPYPLSDTTYRQVASDNHPPKTSRGPGGQDNWTELAVACMKARAVLFCNSTPGDITGLQQGSSELQTLGQIGSIAGPGISIGSGIANLAGFGGTLLSGVTLGASAALTAILDVFEAHAQAEQVQEHVLASLCPQATSAIRQIDRAVINGQAAISDAIGALAQLNSTFYAAITRYYNDCNAFCWYRYIVQCISASSQYLYALAQYQPKPVETLQPSTPTPVIANGTMIRLPHHAGNTTIGGTPTVSENWLATILISVVAGVIVASLTKGD